MHPFSKSILEWYGLYGRDLPWRHTQDPYPVWLSEVILQQTRIAQGRSYWERFLKAFPTVEELAAASEDQVLRLWEGLGYYSRARNLHAAARQIVALGQFPRTLEGIRALKGVGDYTAAAIGSFCFGLPAAVVDGNVYRVLSRHFGIATPIGTGAAKKEFQDLANSLLPEGEAAAFNQGIMDFGALQCTPQQPLCLTCPLQHSCHAFRYGQQSLLPVKKAPVAVQDRHFTYLYLRVNGCTPIRRRGTGDIWQGLWEPLSDEAPLDPLLLEQSALVRSGVRHLLTHRRLIADFRFLELPHRPALPEGYIWVDESALDTYAKPRLFELLLASLDYH